MDELSLEGGGDDGASAGQSGLGLNPYFLRPNPDKDMEVGSEHRTDSEDDTTTGRQQGEKAKRSDTSSGEESGDADRVKKKVHIDTATPIRTPTPDSTPTNLDPPEDDTPLAKQNRELIKELKAARKTIKTQEHALKDFRSKEEKRLARQQAVQEKFNGNKEKYLAHMIKRAEAQWDGTEGEAPPAA